MASVAPYLLAVICGVTGLILTGALLLVRRYRRSWSYGLTLSAAIFFLLALGGTGLLPRGAAVWLTGGALAGLFAMLAVVVLAGHWWAPLAYGAAGLLAVGLAALAAGPFGGFLRETQLLLASLELEPWWLLLLGLVPIVVGLSYRSLAGLGPVRQWLAIGLRCLLIVFLTLALAEAQARRPNDTTTVLFLWDRSLSIPQEWDGGQDQREARIKQFINQAVAQRGPHRAGDRAGVIVFGRRPRLELPPASVPELRLRKIASPVDATYTDIAAALKLALASFPEGTGKRIVLISDGNQNLGNAEEQARIARQNNVQIDVVPIAAGTRNPNEVLVERVEVPAVTEKGGRLPLWIILRSYNPHLVVGNLRLIKTSLGVKKVNGIEQPAFETQVVGEQIVKLRQGLNAIPASQPGARDDDSYTYEAIFVPFYVEREDGTKLHDGLPGDRIENNRASASVMARGQRAVLLIEPKVGEHKLLADRLRKAKSGLRVVAIDPNTLPTNPTRLALVLSKFDSVILANLPVAGQNAAGQDIEITEEQQKVIRSNTHDQGCGLVMIGGPQSFGAGGWQGTEVEKALPVTSDLKSVKVEGKSGLVLIMHASEMADGNAWQKKIAKLAIERLSPMDMVGMLYFDWQGGGNGHKWHIPFQLIGEKRGALLRLVDSMVPGDMPDVDPAFLKAYTALTNPAHALGTKHIIFISDGDHWDADRKLMAKMNRAGITCTTVCITSHGANEVKKMALVARLISGPKGRSYHVKDPKQLPAIYIKESRLVSQSFVHEKKFQPRLVPTLGGPTEGIRDLELLYGFVRTTRRPSPLVEVPIETPKIGEATFPILAYWQYGLGKSIAFTSDARTIPGSTPYWDRDWANSTMYAKFWEQAVDWSLRAVETGKHLTLTTEQRDGMVRIIIDARDSKKLPLTEVELKAGITSPLLKPADARRQALKFEQKNSGVYEAEFKAEDIGSYFINVQARWKENGKEKTDSVRTGVTIPYSPEFAEMESKVALLERLREFTGGKSYADEPQALERAARSGDVFRPMPAELHSLQAIWYWLVALTGIGLFFDVAVRRIAVEPHKVAMAVHNWWLRLRGRQVDEAAPQFLERLKSRKAQVGEELEKGRAGRRFEPGEGPVVAPAGADEGPSPGPRRAPHTTPPPLPVGPEQEKESADYASRLLRAKRRAMEEREKGRDA
jgi:uncharacterized membrane protein